MTVKQLRSQLLSMGMSEKEVAQLKNKAALEEALFDWSIGEVSLDSIEVPTDDLAGYNNGPFDEPVQTIKATNDEECVSQVVWGDPNWSDYVLSELDSSEKKDGQPTTAGLRRVSRQLGFDIIDSTTNIIQAPNDGNDYSATVLVQLSYLYDTHVRTTCGAADISEKNTDSKYGKHSVATAETRAEGRALRKMLLIDCITAEEKTEGEFNPFETTSGDVGASEAQIKFIESAAKDRARAPGVNITKLLEEELPGKTIKTVTNDEVISILKVLSAYQNQEIPQSIAGYNDDWKG